MHVLDQFKLEGKIALVTGCRRGIGKAMALALAEAGADIIGVSASLEKTGSQVEREVRALGREFRGYACDFSNRKALYAFIKQVQADFPTIDILVNNAGTILRKPAVEYPDEYWDKVIEVNLNAQFILSREIGKRMVERGQGKIIFTASLLSFQGGILVPGYAASKGGVGQLAKALAMNGRGKVSTSTPSYPVISAPTTRRLCETTRSAPRKSWLEFPPGVGAGNPMISREPLYSSPHLPRIMSTVPC